MSRSHRILTVFGSLSAILAIGLLSQAAGTSSAETPSHNLQVKVLSVKPGLAPYNPALASAGIPVEFVKFVTKSSPSRPFTCTVVVRHRGKVVGRTRLNANPSKGQREWTIQVDVKGPTFSGRPIDARVDCRDEQDCGHSAAVPAFWVTYRKVRLRKSMCLFP
jgi:hypothetical protein